MPGGPSYSVASCVIETGNRLIATPGEGEDVNALRRVGRALLRAEVCGFGPIAGGAWRRRYGQGLEIQLGFYDAEELGTVKELSELVADELSDSVGGWGGALQLGLRMLHQGEGWLGTAFDWPHEKPHQHLDIMLPARDVPPGGDAGKLCVLGRRLRYRLGVDHNKGEPDLFWWTTPQTEYWIERYLYPDREQAPPVQWRRPGWGIRRAFNSSIAALFFGKHGGVRTNFDASANSSDDWGYVDLERDPIRVLAVGPRTGGQTLEDVRRTLARAGSQLRVDYASADFEQRHMPGLVQAEALADLASRADIDYDVVLLYRGGFGYDAPPSPEIYNAIVDAAGRLVSRGVEVVLGLGHGTTDIHGTVQRLPSIGVYEAVTPTAAANWILAEHVNQRLMNAVPDAGQTLY